MAASGMRVVCSFHCDIPEVIRHRETGLLADEKDIDGLVEHLRWLIDHPEKWSELTDTSRKYIEQEFSAVIQSERLAEIYKSILS